MTKVTQSDSYAIIPTWILFHEDVTREAIVVWLTLWSYTSGNSLDDRSAFPKRKTAADRAGMNVRTFDKHLKVLIDMGAVTREYQYHDNEQTNSNYILHFAGEKGVS